MRGEEEREGREGMVMEVMEGEARGDRGEEEKGYGKTRRRGEGEAEGLVRVKAQR